MTRPWPPSAPTCRAPTSPSTWPISASLRRSHGSPGSSPTPTRGSTSSSTTPGSSSRTIVRPRMASRPRWRSTISPTCASPWRSGIPSSWHPAGWCASRRRPIGRETCAGPRWTRCSGARAVAQACGPTPTPSLPTFSSPSSWTVAGGTTACAPAPCTRARSGPPSGTGTRGSSTACCVSRSRSWATRVGGGEAVAVLGADRGAAEIGGRYFRKTKAVDASRDARDRDLARDLWDASRAAVGEE